MPRIPRRLVAAALAASIAVALAACSTGGPASTTSSAATRTVSTAKGRVAVPTKPLRIVSVHSFATESLFDLGAKVVGVEDSGEQYIPKRYASRWRAATKVTDGATIDYEKIAALKPDLIVGVDVPYLDKAYKKLSAIAPTAFTTFRETSTWETYPKAVASYIGAGSALTALQTKYTDAIADTKTTYAAQLATTKWDVIQGGFDSGNYWIYPTDSDVGNVITALGGHFASATNDVKPGATNSVSYENTSLLNDADAIVYYENPDGSPANNIDKLFALQGWKDLPAAQADHVVGTPDFLPGSYSDAIGIVQSLTTELEQIKTRS